MISEATAIPAGTPHKRMTLPRAALNTNAQQCVQIDRKFEKKRTPDERPESKKETPHEGSAAEMPVAGAQWPK
jgi:hypothetical protein